MRMGAPFTNPWGGTQGTQKMFLLYLKLFRCIQRAVSDAKNGSRLSFLYIRAFYASVCEPC